MTAPARKPPTGIEVSAEVLAGLLWGSKTITELGEYVGLRQRSAHRLLKHLRQFRAAGVVYVSGYSVRLTPVYAVQPKPFAVPDAVRPETAAMIGARLGIGASAVRKRRHALRVKSAPK